jgi:hypothetical protein
MEQAKYLNHRCYNKNNSHYFIECLIAVFAEKPGERLFEDP